MNIDEGSAISFGWKFASLVKGEDSVEYEDLKIYASIFEKRENFFKCRTEWIIFGKTTPSEEEGEEVFLSSKSKNLERDISTFVIVDDIISLLNFFDNLRTKGTIVVINNERRWRLSALLLSLNGVSLSVEGEIPILNIDGRNYYLIDEKEGSIPISDEGGETIFTTFEENLIDEVRNYFNL